MELSPNTEPELVHGGIEFSLASDHTPATLRLAHVSILGGGPAALEIQTWAQIAARRPAHAFSASRTFFVSVSRENGFMIRILPASSTPWWAMAESVYPDMNSTFRPLRRD